MKIEILKDYEELSNKSLELIIKTFLENPTGLYCFAGGDTPIRTLELLVKEHQKKTIDLTKAFYIELDEWVGLDETNNGSCIAYLNKLLFIPAKINKSQIHTFNAKNENLELECQKANEFIEKHNNITLSLLGVGENGHLGFNEPFVDFNNLAHISNLDKSTQKVGKKYFDTEVDRTKGITLGIKQLLESDVLIIQASGTKKRKAIKKLLEKKQTNKYPITAVINHENTFVFIDEQVLERKAK